MSRPSVTYIANATAVIDVPGMRLLCDPWLTDGAFEGSWYHFPPLQTKPEDLEGITHAYILHIHPDHFDPATLLRLPRKVPVIVADFDQPWMRRRIEALGFEVIAVPPGEAIEPVPGIRVWAFTAFTANPLWPSEVPNVIDSAIVVENGDWAILNANDNTPDPDACRMLRNRFGCFDLAMLPYSGASEYPSCFSNLDADAKRLAAEQKILRYLDRLVANVDALQPAAVLPFAGQYILGGPLHVKNPYLGIPALERAVEAVQAAGHQALAVREGDVVDVLSSQVASTLSPSGLEQEAHEERIAGAVYWYLDSFRFQDPDRRTNLLPLVTAARRKLATYQERFGWAEPYRVLIRVPDEPRAYLFDFATESVVEVSTDAVPEPPYLVLELPYALLLAMLTRHVNFNNAAIGCHIEFTREPEVYRPEVFTLLAFLQV